MNHLYTYETEVLYVVDGDTYDFEVDLGFNVFKRLRVRLLGLDTHEIYGVKKESREYELGKRQMEFAEDVLFSADEIVLKTYKDETGKYGRYLAEVIVDGDQISNLLIEEFDELTQASRSSYGLLIEQKKNQ